LLPITHFPVRLLEDQSKLSSAEYTGEVFEDFFGTLLPEIVPRVAKVFRDVEDLCKIAKKTYKQIMVQSNGDRSFLR
jgi:hypothetical protein